jgi:dipeptidyl aminopeptidase/acylaminoacyl peptidase
MSKIASGLNRRNLLLSSSIVTAGLMLAGMAAAAPAMTPSDVTATQAGQATVRAVEFKNNDITMSGNVYYPKGFSEGQKYPAIVVVHPGGGVKEQAAGLYAQKLAEQGFVTLAFDASHQAPAVACPALSMTR